MRRLTQSGLFAGAIQMERAGFPAILRCRSLTWNDQAALSPPGFAGKPAPSWWCESVSASLATLALIAVHARIKLDDARRLQLQVCGVAGFGHPVRTRRNVWFEQRHAVIPR